MLPKLSDAVIDPESHTLEWIHTAAEIVEGVEVVMAVVGAAGASGVAAGLVGLFEKVEALGGGMAWPIGVGVAAIVGEFAVLGLGYEEAANEIKKDRSASGFSQGVIMGAMRERGDFVKSNFWKWSPESNPAFPEGGKIAQAYYNAALVLGFSYGKELTPDQRLALFQDLARQGGAIADLDQDSSERQWRDFYIEAGARFRKLHIR
jgi:hypothetical protein